MRAIEKLWTVANNIHEVRKITPLNEPCSISHRVFEHMEKNDVDKIFRKLSKDDKVVNVINIPESWVLVHEDDDTRYSDYIVGVLPSFDSFFEDTYRQYGQGIHKLTAKNFLAIHELVLDIEQEIEMASGNAVTVEVLSHTMRFPGLLFPRDSSHFRNAYCDLRIKSADWLKRHGAIKSYDLIDNYGSGWEASLKIIFDTFAFDNFADKTKAMYKKDYYRPVKDEASKQQASNDAETMNDNTQTQQEHPNATIQKVDVQRPLRPSSYHSNNGKLTVSPTLEVSIAVRGKVKRKGGIKYGQCHLMSCLFKNVKSLKDGITFSTFLGVKYDKNTRKHIRKVRNTVDAINNKVSEKTKTQKLIFIQGERIFLDKSYL